MPHLTRTRNAAPQLRRTAYVLKVEVEMCMALCTLTAQALFRYTPRELSKAALRLFGALALIVGIGIGAAVNKTLSQRTGWAARHALAMHSAQTSARQPPQGAPRVGVDVGGVAE
jgi:hypothetical protein